jgi:hypothetical protein
MLRSGKKLKKVRLIISKEKTVSFFYKIQTLKTVIMIIVTNKKLVNEKREIK